MGPQVATPEMMYGEVCKLAVQLADLRRSMRDLNIQAARIVGKMICADYELGRAGERLDHLGADIKDRAGQIAAKFGNDHAR